MGDPNEHPPYTLDELAPTPESLADVQTVSHPAYDQANKSNNLLQPKNYRQ